MKNSGQPLPQETPYLFVANWKMYFSHHAASLWATTHFKEIEQMIKNKNISFIICPSFDALATIAPYTKQHTISLGAQDCSSFLEGAYTGQVSAVSLQEIGCVYGIVGHSETRLYEHLKNSDIAHKIEQLIHHDIIPIICVGETREEYQQKKTTEIIYKQLEPLLPLFQGKKKRAHIAYEPIWAIGTNTIPPREHIEKVFTAISQLYKKVDTDIPVSLYGGSIDEKSIQNIIEIPTIQGILVGRTSTDFQKIKTIVSLLGKRSLPI